MKKILAIIIISVIAFFVYNKSKENTTNVLRVGTEAAYLPWNGLNASNEVIGFEIDLAKALCVRIDMTCEIIAQDWDGIIPSLQNNKYDIIMAGMTVTSKRLETIDFSRGYADTGVAFASTVMKEVQSIPDLQKSLEGKKIGVQTGTIAAQYVQETFELSDVRSYNTQDELNIDLLSGRIHAAANDTSAWYDLQKSESSVAIISPVLTGKDNAVFGEGIGIGIKKGREALLAKLNKALDDMREDGSLSKLATQWFGFDASIR